MRRTLSACLLAALFVTLSSAQNQKPWTEWSRKDAEKMLNDSPWGQTQVTTQNSQNESTITSTTASRRDDSRVTPAGQQQSGTSLSLPGSFKYRIRLLSAKPVRQAFARMVLLKQQSANESLTTQLQAFVDRAFDEYIVIAVDVETNDKQLTAFATQVFGRATTETLKGTTYLERKDGRRLSLLDYRAPGTDGIGAKFVFQRALDGHDFLTTEADNVRFVAEVNEKIKLNMKYKISEMMYGGKLEY